MANIAEAAIKAALLAVERSKPSGVYFGKVVSVDPIQINVDQKLTLTEQFIVLGRYITEFSVDYTIKGQMWRGLRKGDELILVREQGGQRYFVIDWIKRVEEESRPAQIMEGEVVSAEPLEIKANDYLTLTAENLIVCYHMTDYKTYLSFDNPLIKQKIDIYDKAELETLPAAPHPGEEPHAPNPDDTPPPVIEKTTDITFAKKRYGDSSDDLPTYHEITVYNHIHVGDKVVLVCERSSQKWFVVDYVFRNILSGTGGIA